MTTEYIEQEFEVRIYYIQDPVKYDFANKETQVFLDITKLNHFGLYCEEYWNEHNGYKLVNMEIVKADMVHLQALYERFQENGVIRSMMVGDIIKVNEKYYVVAGIGFEELDDFEPTL